MVDGCWGRSLLTLLSNYEFRDIYNAYKFGLFYECFPNITYQPKCEKCTGRKLSKMSTTGLAVANPVRGTLSMFVIGKAKRPRRFKNMKFSPCRYRNQHKRWTDGVSFQKWVRQKEKKFVSEGKKVALVIDNCPAHPQTENLISIKLLFLPPNTTSQTQPMD